MRGGPVRVLASASALAFAAVAASCGFAGSGLEGDDSAPDGGGHGLDATSGDVLAPGEGGGGREGSTHEASAGDGGSDGGASCVDALDKRWTVVAMETATNPCPDNQPPKPAIGPPDAGPGTCTCGCMGVPPDCTSGDIAVYFGLFPNQCNQTSGNSTAANGACAQVGGNIQPYHQMQPPKPTGGSCAYTTVGDTTKIAASTLGLCGLSGGDAESVCEGNVPSGFTSCIVATGDQTCPAPFGTKATIYDPNPMLSCSPCGSCAPITACGGALAFYSDTSCGTVITSAPVDGNCDPVMNPGDDGMPFASWKYLGSAAVSCPPATSTPTLMPANPRTLCCR